MESAERRMWCRCVAQVLYLCILLHIALLLLLHPPYTISFLAAFTHAVHTGGDVWPHCSTGRHLTHPPFPPSTGLHTLSSIKHLASILQRLFLCCVCFTLTTASNIFLDTLQAQFPFIPSSTIGFSSLSFFFFYRITFNIHYHIIFIDSFNILACN